MGEKEFEEHLQKHRKVRNKKVISVVFRVALPALIGFFIVVTAIIETIGGGATYDIYVIVPHESSTDHYSRDISFTVFHSIFFSPNPKVSWSTNYVDEPISSAPLRFRVRDSTLETTYVDLTTSQYSGKLSGVNSSWLNFNWVNEDESQDVSVGGRIHYDLDLFWVAFFMIIGIVLIAYSCISAQRISNKKTKPKLQ